MARTRGEAKEVEKLANEFVHRVAALMRAQMAGEVEDKLSALLSSLGGVGATDFERSLKIGRTQVATIVVHCPVPGCKNPGLRPKRNFCLQHGASLSAAEKNRYRQAQIATRAKPKAKTRANKGSRRRG